MRSTINLLLAVMALYDALLVGLCVPLELLSTTDRSDESFWIAVRDFAYGTLTMVTVWILVVISVDRYQALVEHRTSIGPEGVIRIIAATFVFAVATNALVFICDAIRTVVMVVIFALRILGPLVLMAICHCLMI